MEWPAHVLLKGVRCKSCLFCPLSCAGLKVIRPGRRLQNRRGIDFRKPSYPRCLTISSGALRRRLSFSRVGAHFGRVFPDFVLLTLCGSADCFRLLWLGVSAMTSCRRYYRTPAFFGGYCGASNTIRQYQRGCVAVRFRDVCGVLTEERLTKSLTTCTSWTLRCYSCQVLMMSAILTNVRSWLI